MHIDQFRGALLGLALGDALGAVHEGGVLERWLWRLLGTTRDGRRRYTDDTSMALDLAESLLAKGAVDQDDLAARFAASYRFSRGYGPAAARTLKRIRRGMAWQHANRSVYASGSLGNGGAMRAPVIGLYFCKQPEQIAGAARLSAEVTHAHPLGMEGAAIIATATAAALEQAGGAQILAQARNAASSAEFLRGFDCAENWLQSGNETAPQTVRKHLGIEITAARSCVTAVYLAARFLAEPLQTMLNFIAKGGGDVDTVGAMAGAIWGAHNGHARLPIAELQKLEDAGRIDTIARRLFDHLAHNLNGLTTQ